MIGSIITALAKIGSRRFDVCPLAMRHAPIPERDYAEVLVDSGRQGRMFRALVNLTDTPVAQLRITNVSGFGKKERVLFAAFAEAQEYRIVQRITETVPMFMDEGLCFSKYAVVRRQYIANVNAYYYLTPFHETDVVLAPEACDCCFDFAHLDYMRSCFDLTGMGAMLFIRFLPSLVAAYLKSPLMGWMKRAGFEAHWFLGADNIKDWKYQAAAGQEFSLEGESRLFILNRNKAQVETNAFCWAYRDKVSRDNYLVFQRVKRPSASTMQALFLEIIEWENANMGQRLSAPAQRIERAQRFLVAFKEQLPNLLAAYGSSAAGAE